MSQYTIGKSSPAVTKGYDGPADLPETLSLDEDDLPQIKSWTVGKTYTLTMDVKLVGQSQDSMDKTMRGRFEITDVQEADDNEDGGDDNGN